MSSNINPSLQFVLILGGIIMFRNLYITREATELIFHRKRYVCDRLKSLTDFIYTRFVFERNIQNIKLMSHCMHLWKDKDHLILGSITCPKCPKHYKFMIKSTNTKFGQNRAVWCNDTSYFFHILWLLL